MRRLVVAGLFLVSILSKVNVVYGNDIEYQIEQIIRLVNVLNDNHHNRDTLQAKFYSAVKQGLLDYKKYEMFLVDTQKDDAFRLAVFFRSLIGKMYAFWTLELKQHSMGDVKLNSFVVPTGYKWKHPFVKMQVYAIICVICDLEYILFTKHKESDAFIVCFWEKLKQQKYKDMPTGQFEEYVLLLDLLYQGLIGE